MKISTVPPVPVEPEYELRVSRVELATILAALARGSLIDLKASAGKYLGGEPVDDAFGMFQEIKHALGIK